MTDSTDWHNGLRPGLALRTGVAALGLALSISLPLLLLAGPAAGAARAQSGGDGDGEPTPEQRIAAVIEQLTAEAEDLDNFEDDSVKLHFKRPHPQIADLPTDMAELVLQRMSRNFTGNAYRDTYIRWHLLWLAKQMMHKELEKFQTLGEHDLPSRTTQRLLSLLQDMPGPIRRKFKDVRERVPKDLWAQWHKLRRQTRLRIGYPPFDNVYHGRAALQRAEGAKKQQIKAALKKMDELRPKLKTRVNEEAKRFNSRARNMNQILRQYRGELIYALIQTGDDQMFMRAIDAIGRKARDNQWSAFDLMRYMYLAAFDGYLQLYDDSMFRKASQQLKRIAQDSDQYRVPMMGDQKPPRYFRPQERNFGEYAFHMVHLLDDPDTLDWFQKQVDESALPALPKRQHGKNFEFTPYNFTMQDIRVARQRAARAVYNPEVEETLNPSYSMSKSRMERLRHVHRGSKKYQRLVHEFGNQALICWALLAGGENFQDPRLFRRINWVLASDSPYTFDRGMRMQMLANLPYERWRPWSNRDRRFLTSALSPKGNWPYKYTGDKFGGWGNHANGAYGVLGLWGAQEAGVEIPTSVWKAVDQHWRKTQQQTPPGEPAGWAVGMFNVDDEDSENNNRDSGSDFYSRVSGPMTAAGVATLTLTERYLYGDKRTDPDEQNVSKHLRKGLDWLDQNFRIKLRDPTADWYYYMWTVQRVGQATGYRTFNDVDWFREVTAEMLNRQQENGLWEDPSGSQSTLVSTGFAMLYLANSYAPIAVSKVRFDGEWNNRPYDIWNFTDYASDQYEVDTAWQIIELNQPVYQLIESPMLYLSTDEEFELAEAEIQRLRNYIEAGGMLVLNPDQRGAGVARSFQQLVEQLFPGRELKDVPSDHDLRSVHQKLPANIRMKMVSNGVRPLIVQFVRDISEGLQTNAIGRGSFAAMNNLYLYSVALNPRRTRLERDYVVPAENSDSLPRSLKVARLKHTGTHNPEPGALSQFKALLARDHGVDMQLQQLDPAKLSGQRLAFLTTLGDAELTSEQADAIRQWLGRGGTLWVDAAGGTQAGAENAQQLIEQIAPDAGAPTRLGSLSPIISGEDLHDGYDNRRIQFRYFALRRMGPVDSPRLQAVEIDGRPAIIFSPEDITAGLAGVEHWGINGYSVQSARRLVTNSALHALNQAPVQTTSR